MKNKKILVTGATGLIGSNLLKRLQLENFNVQGISTKDGDLKDRKYCNEITKNCEIIFHCAANTSGAEVMQNSPLSHVTPNIIMNANLLESCYFNKIKKFIFMSSSVVYPYTAEKPNTEDEFVYGDIYEKYFAVGWMKRYTENLCELYSKHLNPSMQCIILRPANIYGPGDKYDSRSHVLPATIMKVVRRDNPIKVWGDGKEVRDFIYIDDFVEACIRIIDNIEHFEIFNVGSGEGKTVNDILNECQKIENYFPEVTYDSTKPSMIPIRLLDVSKIHRVLGFKTKTTLTQGLEKTIKWYKENYGTKK